MKLHNTLLHYYKYSGMGMKRANCLHGYGQSIINKHCLLWIAVPIKQRMKIILCKYENAHSTDSILLFVLWLFHQSFMKFNTVIQFLKASFVYRLITANSWRAFWLQFFFNKHNPISVTISRHLHWHCVNLPYSNLNGIPQRSPDFKQICARIFRW